MSDLVLHLEGEAPPEPVPPRTPHFGHAVFFLLFALGTVTLVQFVVIGIAYAMPAYHALTIHEIAQLPKITIFSALIAYTLVLSLSILFFPLMWHRSFGSGISWNASAAKRMWYRLVALGILIAFVNAFAETFLSVPKDLPIDKFLSSSTDLWLVAVLGTLLAPAFEEICFRGFLLPAIAIAWDWFSLPRTPEARTLWNAGNSISLTGMAVGAVLSSIAFVAMHGPQLRWTPGPLVLLFCVSLTLSAVRIRLRSVAASSLVHASYNGLLFVITFAQTGGFMHLDRMPR